MDEKTQVYRQVRQVSAFAERASVGSFTNKAYSDKIPVQINNCIFAPFNRDDDEKGF